MKKLIILYILFCGIAVAQKIPKEVYIDMPNGVMIVDNKTTVTMTEADSLFMINNGFSKIILDDKSETYIYCYPQGSVKKEKKAKKKISDYLEERFNPKEKEPK